MHVTFASNIASPDDFNKQVEESNLIKTSGNRGQE